ncbi:MAG: hypothetical protein NVS9B1_23650 [Candidatus Dormibacteraceae bacterium]
MLANLDGIPHPPFPKLRLCTWNLHLGIERDLILAQVASQADFRGIDLVALQEASEVDGVEDAGTIASALGPQYRHHQVATHVLAGRVQANALVWNSERIEVLDRDSLKLPMSSDSALSRAERTILNFLPVQQRMGLRFECRAGGHSLLVYVAHLDVVGFKHKREQLARILSDLAERSPADLTVLAGDLNTFGVRGARPRWTRLRSMAAAAGLEDLTTDIGWTHTLPRFRMRQKLDAIFVRCDRPLEYESWSLDLPGSDHIPVFAEILGYA